MENGPGTSQSQGFFRWSIRRWFALTRRKIRMLQAGDVVPEGPILFVVSHPAGFLHALALVMATERPVHCLLPKSLANGLLARFLGRQLGIILDEGVRPTSEAALQQAVTVLESGGAVAVFADQDAVGLAAPGTLATTAAALVLRAEAHHPGQEVTVHPVHLFLPQAAPSREILIYVDSPLDRLDAPVAALSQEAATQAFVEALESRFQDNAFQLRTADLDYFLADLEEVLRAGLQEDWASRSDWKQDTEGFVLSRLVTEWVKQTNYLNPEKLITLRKSLDDYRALQRQCALREFEVDQGDSPLRAGWRRPILWLETLLGLPIALYGLLNHALIGLTLFLAGSLNKENGRARNTEWTIRGAVTLGFYALQIFLVAHWRGRAAAGYYAPTLPISGIYLWRYLGLVRTQARPLFVSLTIPALTKKIKRLRHSLLKELDQALASYEEKTSVSR
jgi:1-acyl-sn-glycerol-3-phosphate acyltransferase